MIMLWPSIGICVLFALGILTLAWLSAIDLKLRLLPDELVLLLAGLGVAFRYAAWPYCGPWFDAFLGALAAGGALALVRAIANKIYGFETMGLGDVKLMAAGGIWLGLEGGITAMCIGALAGMVHGVSLLAYAKIKNRESDSFRDMTIPAGPGFCAGILLTAIWQFWHLPLFGGA